MGPGPRAYEDSGLPLRTAQAWPCHPGPHCTNVVLTHLLTPPPPHPLRMPGLERYLFISPNKPRDANLYLNPGDRTHLRPHLYTPRDSTFPDSRQSRHGRLRLRGQLCLPCPPGPACGVTCLSRAGSSRLGMPRAPQTCLYLTLTPHTSTDTPSPPAPTEPRSDSAHLPERPSADRPDLNPQPSLAKSALRQSDVAPPVLPTDQRHPPLPDLAPTPRWAASAPRTQVPPHLCSRDPRPRGNVVLPPWGEPALQASPLNPNTWVSAPEPEPCSRDFANKTQVGISGSKGRARESHGVTSSLGLTGLL